MIPADLVPANCPWPVVLGIDPGTRVLGYGALVLAPDRPRFLACGVLAPSNPRGAIAARLGEIQDGLERLLAALRPAVLALERAFHSRNAQSAFRIGEARGVVLATAARAGVAVHELAPAAAKKAVLGHGGASKQQIARMVAHVLGTGPLDVPMDATDALALALACIRRASQAGAPEVRALAGGSHALAARPPRASNGRDGAARKEGRIPGSGSRAGARRAARGGRVRGAEEGAP